MAENSNNPDFLKQLNEQFKDFVSKTFGEQGTKFIDGLEKTGEQVNEFSAKAIKGFVDFGDQVIKSLKLDENDIVKKSSDQIKDLLKQAGVLKEETEEDF